MFKEVGIIVIGYIFRELLGVGVYISYRKFEGEGDMEFEINMLIFWKYARNGYKIKVFIILFVCLFIIIYLFKDI